MSVREQVLNMILSEIQAKYPPVNPQIKKSDVSERRRSKRAQIRIPAICQLEGVNTFHHLVDLSEGGVAIESSAPPVVGGRVYVSLDMSAFSINDSVRAIGQVVWRKLPATNSRGVFGVAFFGLQPDARDQIARTVCSACEQQEARFAT